MSPAKCPAEKSSGEPFGTALSDSQARAEARKAASSGVSSKSTAAQVTRSLERVLVFDQLFARFALRHRTLRAPSQVLLVHRVQEALDALDHPSGAERREDVEGMLRALHLRVEHGCIRHGAELRHELARIRDWCQGVEVAVDDEER